VKISVITVSYNNCGTLADTLNSVAAQSHPDVEHIIIDGGSKDGTAALLAQWQQRLGPVVSEPDRGIYDAMNKGLALATGDYIGFLNADDVYADPSSLSRLHHAMLAETPDFCYGDLVYVRPNDLDHVVRRWTSGSFDSERLRQGWMPPHPTFYVRRNALPPGKCFDATMRIAADYEFMLGMMTRPGISAAYVPEVLVRMRTGGASNRSLGALWRKSREDLRAMRRHRVGGLATLLAKNLRKIPQFLA